MRLLDAASNGNGTAVQIRGGANRHLDQLHTVYVDGTFDGAAVTLEISHDGDSWFTVPDFSITSKAVMNTEFKANFVRGVVSGGGGSESITLDML